MLFTAVHADYRAFVVPALWLTDKEATLKQAVSAKL
jgi:hypothetical protein